MPLNVAGDLYPMATSDGEQIRHDIAKPLNYTQQQLDTNGFVYTIQSSKTISVVAEVPCTIDFDCGVV